MSGTLKMCLYMGNMIYLFALSNAQTMLLLGVKIGLFHMTSSVSMLCQSLCHVRWLSDVVDSSEALLTTEREPANYNFTWEH